MNKTNKLIEQYLETGILTEASKEDVVLSVLSGKNDFRFVKHTEFIAQREQEYLAQNISAVEAVRKAQKDWLEVFLNEGLQQEGILDRLKVRASTLGNRAASKVAQATTSDPNKKQEFQNNFTQEISKQLGTIIWDKVEKVLVKGLKDLSILMKKQNPEASQVAELASNDTALIDEVMDEIATVFIQKLDAAQNPPNLPSQTPPPLPTSNN